MKEENDDTSFDDSEQVAIPEEGVIVDAAREIRVKLYMGQVKTIFLIITINSMPCIIGLYGMALVYSNIPHAPTSSSDSG